MNDQGEAAVSAAQVFNLRMPDGLKTRPTLFLSVVMRVSASLRTARCLLRAILAQGLSVAQGAPIAPRKTDV
jgi:hypothetical protein